MVKNSDKHRDFEGTLININISIIPTDCIVPLGAQASADIVMIDLSFFIEKSLISGPLHLRPDTEIVKVGAWWEMKIHVFNA